MLVFAVIALLVGVVHDLQHLLDHRRATHPGERSPARARSEPATGPHVGARRGPGRRRPRLARRPGRRDRRGRGPPDAPRRLRLRDPARRSGDRPPHGGRLDPRRRARHRGRRVRTGPQGGPGAADRGHARRRPSAAPATGRSCGSSSASACSAWAWPRCSPACSVASTAPCRWSDSARCSCSSVCRCSVAPSPARSAACSGRRCRALRGVAGELARENAMRNPKRTAATASALMIGVGLVAFITILAASTKASMNAAIDQAFTGDFVIDSAWLRPRGVRPGPGRAVNELPEVRCGDRGAHRPGGGERQHAGAARPRPGHGVRPHRRRAGGGLARRPRRRRHRRLPGRGRRQRARDRRHRAGPLQGHRREAAARRDDLRRERPSATTSWASTPTTPTSSTSSTRRSHGQDRRREHRAAALAAMRPSPPLPRRRRPRPGRLQGRADRVGRPDARAGLRPARRSPSSSPCSASATRWPCRSWSASASWACCGPSA